MKIRLVFLAVLIFAAGGSAFAQNIRFSSQVTQKSTVAGIAGVVTVPAAPVIAFCNAPANAVPCTNKATTYADATLNTPCSTSTQIVLDGTTTCVANPDAQNNWGVWVPPSVAGYAYTVTIAGANFGPFYVLQQSISLNAANHWTALQNFDAGFTTSANNTLTGAGAVFNGTTATFNSGAIFNGAGITVGSGGSVSSSGSGGTMASVSSQGSAATNFGSNLAAQTILSSTPITGIYNVDLLAVQTLAGSGCGAGTNSTTVTLAWTAPGSTGETAGQSAWTVSISANGAIDSNANGGGNGTAHISFAAKSGTPITYTTSSTLASAGCSPVPQYTVYAKVIY